jgi:hypothetical protein
MENSADLEEAKKQNCSEETCPGRAIAQTVSRWLPTAAARVRARVWSCGICGGQSGARAGFLRVLRFTLPIFVPPIAPKSPSSINRGLYNRPEVAAVPSGLSPIPLKKHAQVSLCPLSIYLWLYSPFAGPWPLFLFLILYTVGRTSWTSD